MSDRVARLTDEPKYAEIVRRWEAFWSAILPHPRPLSLVNEGEGRSVASPPAFGPSRGEGGKVAPHHAKACTASCFRSHDR